MVNLLAVPVLLIVMMLQTSIISRLPLLNGAADLMLVILAGWALQARGKDPWIWTLIGGGLISYFSATPALVPLISYLAMTALARFLKRMVWQAPILAMVVVTLVGTLIFHALTILALQFSNVSLPLGTTLSLVTMPSLLLNLLISLPVYLIIADAAVWLYPVESDV